MKIYKVMVWSKRNLYYIVGSHFRLSATGYRYGDGLSKTYLNPVRLQERLTECSLVQKQ